VTSSPVRPLGVVRVLLVGYRMHLKMLATSAFNGVLQVIWPLFFATIAFLMYGLNRDDRSLLYASIGASVMGVWSAVSTSGSGAVQRERWQGTLELMVAAPVPLAWLLLPITTAMATVGLYAMGTTLLWGWLLFGIDVHIAHPWLFALAVPGTVLSVGMLGFLMSVTVVRYRSGWALGNAFELPVWLVSGFLVPIALLPDWVRPVSWLLAPTWGVRAIRESALGGHPLPDLLACIGLGVGYLLIGVLCAESVLRSARQHASLSLT
jgi:ABC-2 type transport system permease protein